VVVRQQLAAADVWSAAAENTTANQTETATAHKTQLLLALLTIAESTRCTLGAPVDDGTRVDYDKIIYSDRTK
jgi:hypothetical protein